MIIKLKQIKYLDNASRCLVLKVEIFKADNKYHINVLKRHQEIYVVVGNIFLTKLLSILSNVSSLMGVRPLI